jgi:hypothetical protein
MAQLINSLCVWLDQTALSCAAVTGGILLLSACLVIPSTTPAQEQGVAPPKDTILARKILMGAIDMNMDEIETMLAPEGQLNLAEGQEHGGHHFHHADGVSSHVSRDHQSMGGGC